MRAAASRPLLLATLLSTLVACSKGKTTRTPDLSGGRDARADASHPPDGPHDGPPITQDGRPDGRTPDILRPDTLRPDTLRPDILPPDILAPDTMPQGRFTAPFTLDFEANGGGLSATGDWEWGALSFSAGANCDNPPLPPAAAHSGTRLWGTVLNDCHNPKGNAETCTTSDPSNDSVLSFEVNIPAGWTQAKLAYWQWFDVFTSFDYGEVRVDGTVATQFCSGVIPGDSGSWEQVELDLAAHIGKKVIISFNFAATSVVNYAGWYIDDLSVTGN